MPCWHHYIKVLRSITNYFSPKAPHIFLLTNSITINTTNYMAKIADIIDTMKSNPTNVRFKDLCKVCDEFFGEARQQSTSHRVYKTPWQGDPRVNIQNKKGMAKAYQVRQVLKAIERIQNAT